MSRLQLEALREFAAGLEMRRDLEETLDSLAYYTVKATRAEGAVVSLVDPKLGITRVGTCRVPKEFAKHVKRVFLQLEDTPVHRVLRQVRCELVHLSQMPPLFQETPIPAYIKSQGWDKAMVAPLQRGTGPPIGLLHGFFPVAVTPDEDERKFHQTLASFAAVAVENVMLLKRQEQDAVDQERLRLGRELHDSVSQTLFSIGLGAQAALESLSSSPHESEESLNYILKLARSALDEMRTLLFKLRPETLQDEGLVRALTRTVEALRSRYGLEVEFETDGEPDLTGLQKHALFRIATEALHNSVKHSQAKKIKMTLLTREGHLCLTVQDGGIGFNPIHSPPGAYGMKTMSERASELGAVLDVESEPGEGTRVQVRVLKPEEPASASDRAPTRPSSVPG